MLQHAGARDAAGCCSLNWAGAKPSLPLNGAQSMIHRHGMPQEANSAGEAPAAAAPRTSREMVAWGCGRRAVRCHRTG